MKSFHIAAHLRRRIASGTWIPELDGLRFIAIASVILYHIHGELLHHHTYTGLVIAPRYVYLDRLLAYGNRGVKLFFVISGFVLARPFAQHHLFRKPAPSLRKYFKRRITRLEPPYIFNLLVLSIAISLVEHQRFYSLVPHLLASIFYVHYFVFHGMSTINPAAWSLEIEVQFYILAPLLCLFFAIRNSSLRRLLIALAMVIAFALQQSLALSPFTLAGLLQYFLAGILFADIFLTLMPRWKHHWAWDVLSLIGWPALFLLGGRLADLWLPFLAILLYVASFRGIVLPILLRNRWIALPGGMCYTIYLWHAVIMTAVERLLDHFPSLAFTDFGLRFLVQGIIRIFAIAIVCPVLFLLLERPCMNPNWPEELWRFLHGRRAPQSHANDNLDPVNQPAPQPASTME